MPSLSRSSRTLFQLCLWLILLFGLGCRFYGLSWDEGVGLHPDERFCSGLIPRIEWPHSFGEWFDSTKSPLNPSNLVNDKGERDAHYVYGQLPLMIAKATIINRPEPHLLGVYRIEGSTLPYLRGLSAFFDCLTIIITLLIARRLLGPRWGLFATTLVSLAAINIQQSHYYTTDSFAATFMTLAFWNGARWVDTRKWYDALGLGLWFGCSLACKLSSAFFAVAWLGFVLLAWRRQGFKQAWPLSLCSFLLAFWTFRTFHPMMFMGEHSLFDLRLDPRFLARVNGEWVGDFGQQLGITSGEGDVPFNVQWVGRKPWLFSLVNLGWWAFGWPLLVAGIVGGAIAIRRPKYAPVVFIAAIFALVSFGVQAAQFSKFTRYYLPLSPMFAILAAFCWRELLIRKPKLSPVVGLSLAYSLLWCVSVTAIYGRPNTRLEASRWVVATIPAETRTLNETDWDDGLPIWGIYPPNGNYKEQRLQTYDLDNLEKRDRFVKLLSESEWLFVSSGRSWQTIPRWPQKWPMMPTFYKALFDGSLGYEKVREFTSYPGFGPFRFRDDQLEEALNVYDHPRVLIYNKRDDFSAENLARILESAPLTEGTQFHPREAPGHWDFLPEPK